ncbi:MAG: adenosine deaminase [Euryarchaeota archaeon]|nr:adenosine deaminase [Euryarchaeota archaeon]
MLGENYEHLETYRNLSILVECYGLTRDHPGSAAAVEYLLSLQSDEGDIRGIYADQYSPNYTAASLEMMVKAGYANDPRVLKAYERLLSIRMDDGGWAIPMRTAGVMTLKEAMAKGTVRPVLSRPSSHWCTGIVLRAMAAHPRYDRSVEAVEAAMFLKSRMFKADPYTDRRAPSHWVGFSYPFWYTDIVSALDMLSRLEMPFDDPDVSRAVMFMKALQQDDGSFKLELLRSGRPDGQRWVSLAFCRSMRRFHGHKLLES